MRQMAESSRRCAESLERFAASVERSADNIAIIKDTLRSAIGNGEVSDISAAIMNRPIVHSPDDVVSHPIALLEGMEEDDDEPKDE